jgi:hypothetical protein
MTVLADLAADQTDPVWKELWSGSTWQRLLASGLNSKKAMYHQYMISRAFIPPWSLAMRDRKLSDQTLPVQAAGTLVSPSERFYDRVAEKSRKFPITSFLVYGLLPIVEL